MDEESNAPEAKFWLHVPLQTTRGAWLTVPPPEGRLTILGHPARLLVAERDLPNLGPLTSIDCAVIRQWLLFDPVSEREAVSIFKGIASRLPVLSLRHRVALNDSHRATPKIAFGA